MKRHRLTAEGIELAVVTVVMLSLLAYVLVVILPMTVANAR